LFDHGSFLRRCGILLQIPLPARASFTLLRCDAALIHQPA
jgi:hypothetical protein